MTRNIDRKRLGQLRQDQGEIANHIIDEFAAGRLSRRDFIRRGTVVGISVPLLGSILAACGSSSPTTGASSSSTAKGAPGAVIKVGIVTPTATINPVTVADQGGLDMLAQTGEYLCLSTQKLTLQPVLATSWTPNSTSDVWTFKIRQGVKFHNGSPLTADDVVYTYQLHTNPKGQGNALSAFGGVLLPAGVKKVDDFTVAFHLSAPNGNFPYLTSSDNYNMIIIPKGYDPAKWQSTFLGTGPFKLGSYTPKSGATFTRNENYWGTKALPSQTVFSFYDTQNPMVLALTGGNIDVVGQFSVSGAQELLTGSYNIIKLKSSAHRELSMRCDQGPFTDKRVRQAVALSINRPQIVQALFKGYSDLGNDSPFAPVYPSTDTTIPQRAQDIAKAKSLLAAAGHPAGFSTQLVTEQLLEIPEYAQIVVQAAKEIGVKHQPEGGGPVRLLRQGHVRELRLAGRHHEHGRLRAPERAERAPDRAAGDDQRRQGHRPVERGPLRQQPVRQAGGAVHRGFRRGHAEEHRRADRDAAAGPDAAYHRVLLQLPDGDGAGRDRRVPDPDRAHLPVQRGQELGPVPLRAVTRSTAARRGEAAGMATENRARPGKDQHGKLGPDAYARAHEHGHHHRDVSGGWLRPAVFGAMDGLVTNVSLIAGVGGGGASAHTIVLTGLAGLAAGAGSMAAGEYVSVSSQNELIMAEVDKERLELEHHPRAEQAELAGMLRARGVSAATAHGRPPRRSPPTRKRRWRCTRWKSWGWTRASCPRRSWRPGRRWPRSPSARSSRCSRT